jgi:hypothetical protein
LEDLPFKDDGRPAVVSFQGNMAPCRYVGKGTVLIDAAQVRWESWAGREMPFRKQPDGEGTDTGLGVEHRRILFILFATQVRMERTLRWTLAVVRARISELNAVPRDKIAPNFWRKC